MLMLPAHGASLLLLSQHAELLNKLNLSQLLSSPAPRLLSYTFSTILLKSRSQSN